MIVVGMALAWAGYTVGFYGFCLVKGYDVSFVQLVSPKGWYSGPWPPVTAPDNVILPTGGSSGTGTDASKGTNPNAPGGPGGRPLTPCDKGDKNFRWVNGQCLPKSQAPGK